LHHLALGHMQGWPLTLANPADLQASRQAALALGARD